MALMPAIQYIKNWNFINHPFSESSWFRFKISLCGSEFYHDDVFPLGYDASFIYRSRCLPYRLCNPITPFIPVTGIKSEDVTGIVEAESEK